MSKQVFNAFQLKLIEKAREAAKTLPACTLCGHNHGQLNQEGTHNYCKELNKVGRMDAVPWLNQERCPACAGLKHVPISAVGPINPSGKTMERWAPKCQTCNGTGLVDK